jgi:hypothetical protein
VKSRHSLVFTLVLLLSASCSKSSTPVGGPDTSSDKLAANTPSVPLAQGGDISGGGKGIVCFSDPAVAARIRASGNQLEDSEVSSITSVETLDLHHALEPRGTDQRSPAVVALDKGETPIQYVRRIERRFQTIVPQVFAMLNRSDADFSGGALHWSSSGVRQIEDAAADERVPENCALVTMAAQSGATSAVRGVVDWGAPELVIDSRLYSRLDDLNKAVLLLHEYAYLQYRSFTQHQDSRDVRDFVGYLIVQSPAYDVNELIRFLIGTFTQNLRPGVEPLPFDTRSQLEFRGILGELLFNGVTADMPYKYVKAHSDAAALVARASSALSTPCETLAGCQTAISTAKVPDAAAIATALSDALAAENAADTAELKAAFDRFGSREALIAQATWVDPAESGRWYDAITESCLPDLARELDQNDQPDKSFAGLCEARTMPQNPVR